MVRTVRLRDGVLHFDAASTAADADVRELIGSASFGRLNLDAALAAALTLFEGHGRTAKVISNGSRGTTRTVVVHVE